MENEKYYRLKYHYLINVELFTNDIKSAFRSIIEKCSGKSKTNRNTTANYEYLESIFISLYEKIVLHTHRYSSFLPLYKNNSPVFPEESFFGCIKNEGKYINNLYRLINIALINHCIIHGFYYLLKKKNIGQETMKISSTNCISAYFGYWDTVMVNHFNETNFRANAKNQNKTYKKQAEAKEQASKVYYPQLFRVRKQKHGNYSKNLLYTLQNFTSQKNEQNTNDSYPEIPGYLYNFAFPVYFETSIYTFDNFLENKRSFNDLEQAYADIYSEFSTNAYSNNIDRLLRMAPLEEFYGFSIFQYTNNLLNKLNHHDFTTTSALTLKDFEGSELIDTLSYLKFMPLKYNAHLFIEFALNEITSETTSFCPTYLNHSFSPHKPIQYYPNNRALSKSSKISQGHLLFRNYINTLNRFTFPIIETLWELGLDQLLEESTDIDIYSAYVSYVEKYYFFLTATFNPNELNPNFETNISLQEQYRTYRASYENTTSFQNGAAMNHSDITLFSNLDSTTKNYMMRFLENFFENPFPEYDITFDALLESPYNIPTSNIVPAFIQTYLNQLYNVFLP